MPCPDIQSCDVQVQKEHFDKFCLCEDFKTCYIYRNRHTCVVLPARWMDLHKLKEDAKAKELEFIDTIPPRNTDYHGCF